MPPLPAVSNVVKVNLLGVNQTTPWNNQFHMQYTGVGPTVANLSSLATTIAAAWNTNLAQLMNTAVTLTQIRMADLTNPAAAQGEFTFSNPGTRVGTALPAQVSMVASKKVNFRWRGGHPRLYLPAMVTADITSGRLWATASASGATSAMNNFLAAVNGLTHGSTTYKMVAVRYFANLAILATPLVLSVNTFVIHGRVDTQRRRLGREIL